MNIKNYEIENSTLNYGLKYGKLVKSDRFIKFQNFVLKKKINKHKIRINNFPFPILDIKLNSDTKKFNLKIIIHKKIYYINCNNNSWLLNKLNKKIIFKNPIRNISILNTEKIISLKLLFLKK